MAVSGRNPARRGPGRMGRTRAATVGVALGVVVSSLASADLRLPPGFASRVYVTGEGFESGRGARGIPATSTLVFDRTGHLYLARTGRRYFSAEVDDLTALYRIPPGGARVLAQAEGRILHGPPLPNPQVTALRGPGELFVTTFDRDRRIGALYRMVDGRPQLFAGGTPQESAAPLLRQPEGVAVDSAGRVYVADRDLGAVVRLDSTGRVLDRASVVVRRPRVLAIDAEDTLWIGADGDAEAPWQAGPGEIWRVVRDRAPVLLLRGPVPAGIALSPAGHLFVADRQAPELFVLAAAGRRVPFAAYTEGDAPRALAFAPDTPETRRAGIAGDLFVVTINLGAWPVNEIVRISGPFDDFVRQSAVGTP
jgi:sugar lactone lactonase YvrE